MSLPYHCDKILCNQASEGSSPQGRRYWGESPRPHVWQHCRGWWCRNLTQQQLSPTFLLNQRWKISKPWSFWCMLWLFWNGRSWVASFITEIFITYNFQIESEAPNWCSWDLTFVDSWGHSNVQYNYRGEKSCNVQFNRTPPSNNQIIRLNRRNRLGEIPHRTFSN